MLAEGDPMKLHQLRYFQAACHHNSITAAANMLHVSQPSISAAIRDLEQEFQVSLLDHQRRNFLLTQEGAEFLEYTEQLLAHIDQFEAQMRSLQKKKLRLGIPPMISSLILPKIYYDYFSQNPALDVSIAEGGQKELLNLLEDNHLDMVFLPHSTPFDMRYRCVNLTQLEIVCCVSLTHPLSTKREIRIQDLTDVPIVLFTDKFFQTERILHCFQEAKITPKILLQTAQISTIKKMVASDLAVGFLFRELAECDYNMTYTPLVPQIVSTVSLVWKNGPYLTEEMHSFLNYVEKEYTTNLTHSIADA